MRKVSLANVQMYALEVSKKALSAHFAKYFADLFPRKGLFGRDTTVEWHHTDITTSGDRNFEGAHHVHVAIKGRVKVGGHLFFEVETETRFENEFRNVNWVEISLTNLAPEYQHRHVEGFYYFDDQMQVMRKARLHWYKTEEGSWYLATRRHGDHFADIHPTWELNLNSTLEEYKQKGWDVMMGACYPSWWGDTYRWYPFCWLARLMTYSAIKMAVRVGGEWGGRFGGEITQVRGFRKT